MPRNQLPLYEKPPLLAVESTQPADFNPACRRCSLSTSCKQPLQGELGEGTDPSVGTLLVVGEQATQFDDAEGRVFRGRDGSLVRPLLRQHWKGDIALELATRCFNGRRDSYIEITGEHIDACRPYLTNTFEACNVTRVVALGASALYAVTGQSINPMNSRRGYTWLWRGGKPIPVFFSIQPSVTYVNKFLAKHFADDLQWALTVQLPPPRHIEPGFVTHLVTTPQEAAQACDELLRGEGFAFDIEWAGYLWDPDFRLLTFAAAPVGRASVFCWPEAALNDASLWGPMEALLTDPDVAKGGSNVKADQHALWCGKRLRVKGITFDTRLERKLLSPDSTANLEDMAELVGMGGHKEDANRALEAVVLDIKRVSASVKKRRASKQTSMNFGSPVDSAMRLGFDFEKYEEDPKSIAYAFLEEDLLHRYVSRDALTTARLQSLFSYQLLRSPERQRIWDKVVLPAATAIQRVEEWGVPYDAQAGQLFGEFMAQQRDAMWQQVQQYAPEGGEFNPGSPQQLGVLLYDKLGLQPPFQTASGAPSTDEEALTLLRESSGHPLPGYILEYRHYQKLVGYSEDWARCLRPDGRIHPSIHLDGARSGRTSCSNPNLQNIPRGDSEDGKRARDCFAAPPGYVLVELDYSQLELRIAALLSGDTVMGDVFRSGIDFHLGTAKLISELAWGVQPELVTSVHRTGAKAFNFGIAYGKTDHTLALDLGISEERAKQIRAAIFGTFVRYGKWCAEVIAQARANGGCWTEWEGERARWRPLTNIADTSRDGAYAAIRARNGAINTPIQGTASEFCIASISKLVALQERGELDAQVVLPIHDSIMLLCPERTWRDSALAAQEAMVDYPWCTRHVPLEVDMKVGTRWGSLEKTKL